MVTIGRGPGPQQAVILHSRRLSASSQDEKRDQACGLEKSCYFLPAPPHWAPGDAPVARVGGSFYPFVVAGT